MYKVLHIMGCSDVGGISTVVLNYYKNIDRSKIHFDIAVKTDGVIGRNARELEELGANIYCLPLKSKNIRKYIEALKSIFAENKYDAVHVHEGTTAFVALKVAKQCGIPKRIAHSHTSAPDRSIKSFLRRKMGQILNFYYGTNFVGCGRLAGDRVFGKIVMKSQKGLVLPNAIDTNLFYYSTSLRNEMRNEMELSDKFVIGMVARLSAQKNVPFALQLIKRLHQDIPNSVLVVAGDGEEKEHIINIIQENNMKDYVVLLGNRNDTTKLYNAYDVFLLPSLYEGFPLAAVEAMACGLPILLSDNITNELSFGEKVFYLSLEKIEEWLKTIQICKNDDGREQRQNEVLINKLDIRGTANILEALYLGLEKRNKK